MIQKYRRRLPHILIPGYAFFLTFRLARGQGRTLSEKEMDSVAEHIRKMKPGEIKAWVVMPDHVHLVYQSAGEEDLVRTLKGLKGASARTLTQSHGRVAPVWQDETFDHILRDEKEMQDTWAYIELNPVRKGLVGYPEDYRWSSGCREEKNG